MLCFHPTVKRKEILDFFTAKTQIALTSWSKVFTNKYSDISFICFAIKLAYTWLIMKNKHGMLSCTFTLKSRSHFVLKFKKNSMNNIINISEESLQVTLFKQAKPGAYEVVAILSLQTDHFLALVYILHFIWLILCTERMLGVAPLILSHTTLNENSILVPKHLQADSCSLDSIPAGMLLLRNNSVMGN